MADGYRFPQQGAGSYYYPQHTQHHHPRQITRNGSPPLRSQFSADPTSPSRSPDHSPGPNLYEMFGQNHQPRQHGQVNGGLNNGQRLPLYSYQHQNSHQQQSHTQHHQNIQQEHTVHGGNGTVLGQHMNFSSGVLSNATPNFTSSNPQNGHSTTPRGSQTQLINDHWAEQLKLHKEIERAHATMVEQHAPNHYARLKGHENRNMTTDLAVANPTVSQAAQESDPEDRGRPSNLEGSVKRQDWHNMDMSGQGLRVLTGPLFTYTFLNELYVASNKISRIPAAIGKLRHLKYLDASNNDLTDIPPELGMCVYLKHLLLFDNRIRTLPNEFGSLYQLEMLGIEGNPLDPEMKRVIMENGTKALISHLREQAPGMPTCRTCLLASSLTS
jgi:CCR4-NOT transcription complex subunit 6